MSPPLYQATHTLWTGLVSVQHSLAMAGSISHLAGLADGLVDVLVSPPRRDGPAHPPETDVERFIGRTVVEES